jgi:hypothetical protein
VVVLLSLPIRPNVFDVQRPASIVVGIIGAHQGPTPIETRWKQEEECRKCG